MNFDEYLVSLPDKRKLSEVKVMILRRLWANDRDPFPKPWVSSAALLTLTGQKYFDRRTRELRNQLGCDVETSYREEFGGHAWRLNSSTLALPQEREYLSQDQKTALFIKSQYCCATCGVEVQAGVRGLQADHRIPLSRGGTNGAENWQAMCNNCNVGKRRACAGCDLECNTCSWAFPETYGIHTLVAISESTLRKIQIYGARTGKSQDEIIEEAATYFLDSSMFRS